MESFCWIRGKVFSIGNFLVSQTGERGLFWKFEGELFWSICWHRKPIGLGTIWCICLSTFPTVFNLCSTIYKIHVLFFHVWRSISTPTYLDRSRCDPISLCALFTAVSLYFFFNFNFHFQFSRSDEKNWRREMVKKSVCRVIWKSRSRHSDGNYDSPLFAVTSKKEKKKK